LALLVLLTLGPSLQDLLAHLPQFLDDPLLSGIGFLQIPTGIFHDLQQPLHPGF
jgi:hypothetical protein